MNTKKPVFRIVFSAILAALYAALTWGFAPWAFGPVQCRFSEALTVLAAVTADAIPGLTIGCFLANLVGGNGVPDLVFGTAASLIAAILSYSVRGVTWKGVSILSPLPPVLVNAVVIGWMLTLFSPEGFAWGTFALTAAQVGLGQLIACYGLGLPLLAAIQRMQKAGHLNL